MAQPQSAPVTTLQRWAEVWSSHDISGLLSLFTDSCIYEDVTFGVINKGKDELKSFAEGIFAAFPDFAIRLTSQFVAGEWAAMEWVISGTHVGDLPGMPATHKKFSIRGSTILELEGPKIRRNSDYWDLATFLKQVGLSLPLEK
jgi:steroid delta-isomerase-like uncharacterized protein